MVGEVIARSSDVRVDMAINFSRSCLVRSHAEISRATESTLSEPARNVSKIFNEPGIPPLGSVIDVERHPSKPAWPAAGETIHPIALEPILFRCDLTQACHRRFNCVSDVRAFESNLPARDRAESSCF